MSSLTEKQDNFIKRIDKVTTYMKNLGVSKDMEKKIQKWFDFTLNQKESQGTNLKDLKIKDLFINFLLLADFDVLSFLPINIQTDLAILVHFDMLSKVKLFQVNNVSSIGLVCF